MASVLLKGITWGHSRGITPLLAVSQRYHELHPDVQISWDTRTLQQFAGYPIEELAKSYDLLIIDHPWVGMAAITGCVLALDKYLDADYLQNQQLYSIGHSHESYHYQGHQWALAIDAATPVASYRPDLLPQPTHSWHELMELAARGRVAVPAIPIDLLMNFYTFCIAAGEEPFSKEEEVVGNEVGMQAIETMRQLYSQIHPQLFQCNPIAVAELMSSTNNYWYCPFAYGYSNYARLGYARNLLQYTDVVRFNSKPLCTTLGGTGLSVSANSRYKQQAADFAAFAVSERCQTTLYVQHGGQPGHGAAYTDALANTLTHNYFRQVLPALQRSYMRPRYAGYLYFQDHAGLPLQQYLLNGGNAAWVLQKMNELYLKSRKASFNKQLA